MPSITHKPRLGKLSKRLGRKVSLKKIDEPDSSMDKVNDYNLQVRIRQAVHSPQFKQARSHFDKDAKTIKKLISLELGKLMRRLGMTDITLEEKQHLVTAGQFRIAQQHVGQSMEYSMNWNSTGLERGLFELIKGKTVKMATEALSPEQKEAIMGDKDSSKPYHVIVTNNANGETVDDGYYGDLEIAKSVVSEYRQKILRLSHLNLSISIVFGGKTIWSEDTQHEEHMNTQLEENAQIRFGGIRIPLEVLDGAICEELVSMRSKVTVADVDEVIREIFENEIDVHPTSGDFAPRNPPETRRIAPKTRRTSGFNPGQMPPEIDFAEAPWNHRTFRSGTLEYKLLDGMEGEMWTDYYLYMEESGIRVEYDNNLDAFVVTK